MYVSIATTHAPATDLGFLLMKHPERVHEVELAFGKAIVFYPEATVDRCEAVLVLDVDPIGLVRGRGSADGLLDAYVNDRPYAASSLLSVALNRVFRTAMTANSRERPELAAAEIPLAIEVTPLAAPGGERMVRSLFEPLGWQTSFEPVEVHGRASRYGRLRLTGTKRLADALGHVYVLIPVLDADKHYWVGEDEVDKLVERGKSWLPAHPQREMIARRYLRHQRSLARMALARLAPEEIEAEEPDGAVPPTTEDNIEAPIRLNDARLDAVLAALAESGATSVADLGCGEGKLLARLVRDRRFTRLVGLDACTRSLERATQRLKLNLAGGPSVERVRLLHGALTYRDERWHGVDAAVLIEVIEHLDPERIPALARVVFKEGRPRTVIVTTPNADYNALFPNLPPGQFRHEDHRFEWNRREFRSWCESCASRYSYSFALSEIGTADETLGAPTQMAVFRT